MTSEEPVPLPAGDRSIDVSRLARRDALLLALRTGASPHPHGARRQALQATTVSAWSEPGDAEPALRGSDTEPGVDEEIRGRAHQVAARVDGH